MRAAEASIARVVAEGGAGKGDGTSAAGMRVIVYDWQRLEGRKLHERWHEEADVYVSPKLEV